MLLLVVAALVFAGVAGAKIDVSRDHAAVVAPLGPSAVTYDGFYEIAADGRGRRRLLGDVNAQVHDMSPARDRVVAWTDRGFEVISVDGRHRQLLDALPPRYHGDATWSSATDTIAYSTCDPAPAAECGSSAIWLVQSDATERRSFSRKAYGPTWSPSGRRLAYVKITNAYASQGRVTVARADGGRHVAVHGRQRHIWPPVWSPDGMCVAYSTENSYSANPPLRGHIACARRPHQTIGARRVVAWAPASRIATLVPPTKRSKYASLEMVSLTGERWRLTAPGSVVAAAWSPSARQLAYVVYQKTRVAGEPPIESSQIFVTRPGRKVRRRVTQERQNTRIREIFWSRDGRRLFYTRYDVS